MCSLDGSVKLAGNQKSMDPMATDGKSEFSVPASTPFSGFWGKEMIYKVLAPTLQPVFGFDLACQDKGVSKSFLMQLSQCKFTVAIMPV